MRNCTKLSFRILVPLGQSVRADFGCLPIRYRARGGSRRAGYEPTSCGFANLHGTLRSMSMIEYLTKGRVKAEDILFPDWP
jgi:hypothetical protein